MSVGGVRGLSPSGTALSSTVICGNGGNGDRPIVSTGCRHSPTEASGARLSVEGVIDGDLDHVRLRFLLFGLSMPV